MRHVTVQSRHRRESAFTLVEVLIVVVILLILVSVVMPQFAIATRSSQERALGDTLRYIRSQIELYAGQHGGIPPGFPNGDTFAAASATTFVMQMTHSTNAKGQIGPASEVYPFGPYLKQIPTNPVNGLSTLRVVDAFPDASAGTHGWVYEPSESRFASDAIGIDAEGVPYFEY
jgi:prepilin-type N-terminal cleavage/methylation domain-containing protein